MECSAQPARKATSKIFIDISDSEDSADPSKTIQRTEAGEQSSEDDGDVSDRGHDDFQKRTARFAATITKKCRCRLCRTHHSAGRLTAEQLIKGGKHYIPPFRKPATAAPTKALREWVAALFWCSHREERETWENLRNREREYINSSRRPPSEGDNVASQSQDGGSMYSLACRTRGIIPLDYCSLCDHSD